jgi:hypothetical protein
MLTVLRIVSGRRVGYSRKYVGSKSQRSVPKVEKKDGSEELGGRVGEEEVG